MPGFTNDTASERRDRLHNLIDVTLRYRASSKSDLAQFLGRDHSRLYPDTDNPKLDMIVGLAEALDWPVDAVVEYIWRGKSDTGGGGLPADFCEAKDRAIDLLNQGDFGKAMQMARHMQAVARSADERSWGLRLESCALEGKGQYARALNALRSAMEAGPLSESEQRAVQGNMASLYYVLWDLIPAIGISQHMIRDLSREGRGADGSVRTRVTEAFAYYVSGSAQRRLMTMQAGRARDIAVEARQHLERAAALFESIVRDHGLEDCGAVLNTCRAGLTEVQVELGALSPAEALAEVRRVLAGIDADSPDFPKGDWLESYGWWCEAGVNIAFRYAKGDKLAEHVSPLSEQLLEFARRSKNWALAERAVSIQHAVHERIAELTGIRLPYPMDPQSVDLIAGAVGRFPRLRRDGWNLLEGAARAAVRKG